MSFRKNTHRPTSGYCEVLKLKKQVKEYLLGDWLQGQEVDAKWKSELRETFVSSDMARKKFSAYPDHALPDTAWQVGCPESVSLLADLLDQLVYGDSFDPRFKDAVKSKHAVEDFLAYPSVEKPLANVEAHIRSEKRPPSGGQPQAETSSTGPGAVAASADTETAEAAASAASAASRAGCSRQFVTCAWFAGVRRTRILANPIIISKTVMWLMILVNLAGVQPLTKR